MPRFLLAAIALVTPAVLTGSAPRLEAGAGSSSEGALTHRPIAGVVRRPCIPIDDNGNRTSWAYDALNRTTTKINTDLTTWVYTYDRDSNVRTITDPNGSVATKTYDVLDRLVSCAVARAPGVGGTTAETWEYDGLSRQTKCTDDNGNAASTLQTVEKVYDSLSRLQEERFNGKPVTNVFTGDSKRLSCIYPSGRRINHTFDAIDRVKTTADASGTIATSFWIGPGQRELRRVLGNGTQRTFLNDAGNADVGYDAVQRVSRLRDLLPGGAAFVDRSYAYNRANVRTAEQRTDDGAQEDRYAYDSLYRITQTQLDQGGTGVKRDLSQLDYRLDGVGNRRNVTSTAGSTGTTNQAFVVNAMNEYTAKGSVSRAHSDNGNLQDNGKFTFVYDYKNRLIGAFDKASGAPVSAYLYFCDNRRAQRVVFAPGGGITRQVSFLYDGWQVCEEQNASGQAETTYVYSPVYVDEVVQVVRTAAHALGAGTLYLHQNARFDVVAVTDGSGALVEKRFYDDFGRSFDEAKQPADMVGSAQGNPYGFQGRRLDPETGLYYYRNRFYDPETGRFVQRDPVWDAANFGNQYSFVGNGPWSGFDPLGLWCWGDVAGELSGWTDISKTWKAMKAEAAEGNYGVAAGYGTALLFLVPDAATNVIPLVGQGKALVKSGAKLAIKGTVAAAGAGFGYLGKKLAKEGAEQATKHADDAAKVASELGEQTAKAARVAPESTETLLHGTSKTRADEIMKKGPDANFRDPGVPKTAVKHPGFSTQREGISGMGEAEEYARRKAALVERDGLVSGGPAVIKIKVPKSIVEKAEKNKNLHPEVKFTQDGGLPELKKAWATLEKEIVIPK